MTSYRLFFLGPDDHFVKAEIVECRTDGDAVDIARACCTDHPAIEIWELDRKVDRIDADAAAGSPLA